MSSVTGYTSDKAQVIEDASVIDAEILNGNLILKMVDGSSINAGDITGTLPEVTQSIVSIGSFDKPAEDVIVPIWNTGSNNVRNASPTTPPSNVVLALSWSPDGVYLAILVQTSPYIMIYKRSGDVLTKLTDPASLPTSAPSNGNISWSPDGQYLTSVQSASPYLNIYKRSGDTFTRLSNPATLPTGSGRDAAWAPDGKYLAVTHDVTPFITIYSRVGDVFTKITNPSTLPSGPGLCASYSPNGRHLVVGLSSSPYIYIYKRAGETYTKLADPATLPSISFYRIAWSPDGQYLLLPKRVGGPAGSVGIYKRSGDVFTNLPSSAVPVYSASSADAVDFSPDGQYIALTGSTGVYVYGRYFDTFVEPLPQFSPLLTGVAASVAWSPDGTQLAIGTSTSPYLWVYKSHFGPVEKAVVPTILIP